MKTFLYRRLAGLIVAMDNCLKSGNSEWYEKHKSNIMRLTENHMPHGAGFDNGTLFDFEASKPEKLVFTTAYHHMNENGVYDGWTGHAVTVRPSLAFEINVKISGQNRNDIKELIGDVFHEALTSEIE